MRTIITGASAGIGAALARELAKRGHDLALLARRGDLLDELATELRGNGRNVVTAVCDVVDAESVSDAVRRTQEQLGGPFDLAIANAGVSIPVDARSFDIDAAEQIVRVNVLGVMYLFDAVIPSMIERRSGRFAGVASIAGLRGLPGAAPYSASKAAVQAFLEGVRIDLRDAGVKVTTINPGFVDTPMTKKNRFRMPFLMDAEKAATIIADGIERGKRLIEFPRPTSVMMRAMRLVPDALYDRMMGPYSRRSMDASKVRR
jgi:short-subunit dehydrogenase